MAWRFCGGAQIVGEPVTLEDLACVDEMFVRFVTFLDRAPPAAAAAQLEDTTFKVHACGCVCVCVCVRVCVCVFVRVRLAAPA